MSNLGKVLYVGGFQLPDKNAAAQRVVGIAKCLRSIGYQVRFVNSLKKCKLSPVNQEYFGFSTLEYKREKNIDYLFFAHTVLSIIKHEKPNIVIAYNYPSIALNRIRNYCKKNKIRCIADVTEWYGVGDGSFVYKFIKRLDTLFRMTYVHKRMDAVVVISRFLYDYYKSFVPVALVPPVVDINEEKWQTAVTKDKNIISFVYAGSPSGIKERLDLVVEAAELYAQEKEIILNIVGITKEQFIEMFSWKKNISNSVSFFGRVPHKEAVKVVKKSTWSIIIRDDNTVVKAGFPTKLAESISCGTPVIANRFSNIIEYLNNDNSIVIDDIKDIIEAMKAATKKKTNVDKLAFDYHNYIQCVQNIMR